MLPQAANEVMNTKRSCKKKERDRVLNETQIPKKSQLFNTAIHINKNASMKAFSMKL